MKTRDYFVSLTVILAFFAIGFSASSSESPIYTLNPGLESGLTGEVENCSPLTVTHGSVSAYPTCTITCDSGYTRSGNTCIAEQTPSGGGGGGSATAYCSAVTYGSWGTCGSNIQIRQVLNSSPSGCTLTTSQQLATSQSCSVVPEEPSDDTPTDDPGGTGDTGTTPPADSSNSGSALKQAVLNRERGFAVKANVQLTNRLAGRILLQVEEDGEAWYVEPVSKKKHFMGRPADAFAMMRTFGLGISEANFAKFQKSGVPSRFAGRIFLRVEAKGEAYYVNPVDMKMHFLNRPADAFRIMRELALGISNSNIRQIPMGE